MPVKINAYPQRAQHTQRVEIAGVEVEVRFTWRERLRSWFVDLFDASGAPILLGTRVSPGTEPWLAVIGLVDGAPPDGALVVVGRDPYYRSDFGDGVELHYLREAELPELPAAGDDIVAEVA